ALDRLGDRARLIERLDRARATDDDDAVAADVDAADTDDRVVGPRLTADELVRVRDADDFLDSGVVFEDFGIGLSLRSRDADGSAMRARNRMRFQPHPFDVADDCFDLFRLGAGLHYDEHWISSGYARRNRLRRTRRSEGSQYNSPYPTAHSGRLR